MSVERASDEVKLTSQHGSAGRRIVAARAVCLGS